MKRLEQPVPAFMENVSFVFVSFPESQPYSNSVIALGNGYGIELYPNSTAPSYNLEVRPGDYLNATEYDFGEYVQGAPVDLAFQQVGSYSPGPHDCFQEQHSTCSADLPRPCNQYRILFGFARSYIQSPEYRAVFCSRRFRPR